MSTALLASAQQLADHDGPGHWWPLFPLLWFAFIVTFAIVITRLGWWRRRQCVELERSQATQSDQARLAERFAVGDIDEQEYRARLAVLDETRGSGGKR